MSGTGKLAGKVALVTGGSRGIGGAIVRAFAAEDADVAFCHLADHDKALAMAAEVEALGRRVHHDEADVADPDTCASFAAAAKAALGPIDILVNNAGIGISRAFEDVTVDDFERIMNVHVRGTFFMTQAVYGDMVARGRGRIINISSQLAYNGMADLTPYCAAKGAIGAFTRALAHEATPKGILVNAIAPGPVITSLFPDDDEAGDANFKARLPIGRFAEPHEIAPTAVLLASDGGNYYVGATLSPNGGDVMF
jgi:3-oxoacyl-[acyl-carrier protein] reductase